MPDPIIISSLTGIIPNPGNGHFLIRNLSAKYGTAGLSVHFEDAGDTIGGSFQLLVDGAYQTFNMAHGNVHGLTAAMPWIEMEISGVDQAAEFSFLLIPAQALADPGVSWPSETDPIFAAASANLATKSDVTIATSDLVSVQELNQRLADYASQSETDPVWTAQKANYLTSAQISAQYATTNDLNVSIGTVTDEISAINTQIEEIKSSGGGGGGITVETDPIWTADKPNYLTSAVASSTYTPEADFMNHVSTDKNRWQDYYLAQSKLTSDIAALQGKTVTLNGATALQNGVSFTVNNELGGVLMITTENTDTTFTTLTVNGVQQYTSDGIMTGLSLIKTYVVNNGDTVVINNSAGVEYYPYMVDESSPIQGLMRDVSTLTNTVATLSQKILDMQASIENKVLDTANTADIANSTYTVASALGGRLTGKGAVVLGLLGIKVASTGTVTVNGDNKYDNTSLLGTGAVETLNVDVFDGDVIVSSGMASLTFTPYIAS